MFDDKTLVAFYTLVSVPQIPAVIECSTDPTIKAALEKRASDAKTQAVNTVAEALAQVDTAQVQRAASLSALREQARKLLADANDAEAVQRRAIAYAGKEKNFFPLLRLLNIVKESDYSRLGLTKAAFETLCTIPKDWQPSPSTTVPV